ncbi:MAG TPA: hypothetical protein PLZ52_11560 [Bacteroidales bacterium]|nr:hypothetical protein [Bacteroidales bacterium]HQL69249.1 hypothetical protein [Bacteroidales bacterium]
MKNLLLTITLTVLLTAPYVLKGEELVLRGIYQGIDLYVLNPILDENGDSFCVTEIYVNNLAYADVVNSSAFCLSLQNLSLQIGSDLEIRFVHGSGCAPRVINPEVLKTLSTYSVVDMSLNGNSLVFTTKDETSKINFIVEQYRWNHWVKVAEVQGKGGPDNQTYSVNVYPIHGNNKYRVYQQDHLYRTNLSNEYEFESQNEAITVSSKLKNVKSTITLSAPGSYLIYNIYGDCLLEGYSDSIDVSGLSKGTYILAYENTFTNFTKK